MPKSVKILLAAVGVAILVIAVVLLTHKKSTLGDATVSNYPTWYYNGIVIGKENTLLTNFSFGSCNLSGNTSIGPSAVFQGGCAARAAKVGDKVFFAQSNATTAASASWLVRGGFVSSAGVITATVFNASGATGTAPAAALSNVNYILLR